MSDPFIPNELLLRIAEHCDLKTVLALTQTSKNVKALIDSHHQSISQAKIAGLHMPPVAEGLVTTLRKGTRFLITRRNSLTTIHEFEKREQRISSLLNNGGFLLTCAQSPLRLPDPALQKLKQGLAHAMRLTNRLADADGCEEIVKQLGQVEGLSSSHGLQTSWRVLHRIDSETGSPIPVCKSVRDWLFLAYRKQECIIKELSTSDLAWLLTLADGAAQGFKRYTLQKYEDYNRVVADMAFREVVLRDGLSALWAFVRGSGSDSGYAEARVIACGGEMIWFENGGCFERTESGSKLLPDGLHMTIMQELRRRFISEIIEGIERRRAEAEVDDEEANEAEHQFHPADYHPNYTWARVHEIIGNEIGAKEWMGYTSVEWPTAFENVENVPAFVSEQQESA